MGRDRPVDVEDGRGFVEAPVVAALNRITLFAVIGFAVVAGLATVPLIANLDPGIHEAIHVALPLGWVAFGVAVGTSLILRPAPAESDPWQHAADVDPGLAAFARRCSWLMTVGWLASVGAIVVHHHLATDRDVLFSVFVVVPLAFAAWLLAAFAWSSWCQAMLARAENAAAARLRTYWSQRAAPRDRR